MFGRSPRGERGLKLPAMWCLTMYQMVALLAESVD